MAQRKQCLEKLRTILADHRENGTDVVFRNIFAIACYLSMHEHERAARKQLISLFDWLGWNNRKTYFNAILDSLSDFAEEYASEIEANAEINELFDTQGSGGIRRR